MKKAAALLCALALLAGASPRSLAAPANREVSIQFYNENARCYEPESLTHRVNVTLNGTPMELDVPAVTRTVDGMDGRAMVPIRPIAEALGAAVEWDGKERRVHIENGADAIVLTLGSPTAVVNGEEMPLPGGVSADVARFGSIERTMVPLRFVSEQLHARVGWDGAAYTAAVETGVPEETPQTPPDGWLTGITADDNAQSITLFLDKAPRYRVEDLGDKVAIDLLGFGLEDGDGSLIPQENPVIEKLRFAQHGADLDPAYPWVTRVVLDLAEGCTKEENVTVMGDPDLLAVKITVTPKSREEELTFQPGEDWKANAYTIALDAGHGGKMPGAVYEDIKEKDLTLAVTLRAAQLLAEKGYNVLLTRTGDEHIDLYSRCELANRAGADLFLSIHANASVNYRDFEGTFTYSLPKSKAGERLAGCVQQEVVRAAGSVDRGLLTNDYVVLRETEMPAALLEMGFMTCHRELMRLADPAYQEKIAQGVAAGVEKYLSTLPEKNG